ncbi:MAG: hypothetical protein FWG14_09780 [Peptococcaceae bacterium]|nr:hypothetical protein [Peptococcaceae bacterium]
MEQILKKMKGFLGMEEELPFAEFQQFYTELMALLTAEFDGMSNESRVQGRYVCQVVASNAQARAGKSRTLAKKFKKMSEKCTFWVEAIDYRLEKEGMSKQDIESMTEAVEKAVGEETASEGAASEGAADEKSDSEKGAHEETDSGS